MRKRRKRKKRKWNNCHDLVYLCANMFQCG
jgi:hypothetical protein